MPILNYTTKIDSYKTVSEIQRILSKHGAFKIIVDNDNNGNPIGITFCILHNETPVAFSLPCNFVGIGNAMKKNNKIPKALISEEQAMRVGWRIIKDWIEAQMAIVEAELATATQIFLPYAVTKSGKTIYDSIEQNGFKLID